MRFAAPAADRRRPARPGGRTLELGIDGGPAPARRALFRTDPLGLVGEGLARIPLRLRRHVVALHDLAVAAASLLLSLWLRLGTLGSDWASVDGLQLTLPLFLACFLLAGWQFRLHLGMWRHASLPDLVAIAKTATLSISALYLVLFFAQRLDGIPRSVPLIQWLVLVFMLGGSRLAYRLLRDGRSGVVAALGDSGERLVPVLLVGTGLGTSLFIRALRNSPEQLFRVVGVLEPGQGQTGRHILGVPVIGRLAELESLIQRLEATGQRPSRLIVGDRLPPETLDRLIGQANRLSIGVCRVPEPLAFEDASQRGRIELRPIALEDLLNRPQATLDQGPSNTSRSGDATVTSTMLRTSSEPRRPTMIQPRPDSHALFLQSLKKASAVAAVERKQVEMIRRCRASAWSSRDCKPRSLCLPAPRGPARHSSAEAGQWRSQSRPGPPAAGARRQALPCGRSPATPAPARRPEMECIFSPPVGAARRVGPIIQGELGRALNAGSKDAGDHCLIGAQPVNGLC